MGMNFLQLSFFSVATSWDAQLTKFCNISNVPRHYNDSSKSSIPLHVGSIVRMGCFKEDQ